MKEKGFALVTGASSGIGLQISHALARRGYPILLVSNEDEKNASVAKEIRDKFNVNATPLFMDLSQRDSAQKVFDFCKNNGIRIEILVNNAGIFFFRDITDTKSELVEKTINLHILTPTLLCRLFAEEMINNYSQRNRKSYILNIASIAAWMNMPGIALYSSTKSYLRSFSRSMRCETIEKGLSITTICPGAVATGLYGLAAPLMRLGIRLRIIITPDRLARAALKKMFKKKAEYIPGGIINRIFVCFVKILPEAAVRRLKKLIDKKMTSLAARR
ncbi:MAG: SDR family NAD(P)-dependent oxidoreductase [Treponema sp.]|nr:SDR family NAD(P)-dependent oxidoreductase [Treponema sp.]